MCVPRDQDQVTSNVLIAPYGDIIRYYGGPKALYDMGLTPEVTSNVILDSSHMVR